MTGARPGPGPGELAEILAVLAVRRGLDLRDYHPEALTRRVAERVAATGAGDAAAYGELLRRDPDEPDRLRAALLIGVSSLFREPETFDFLRRTALPGLLRTQPPDAPVRAWVVGCASGEDAYSLAMVLEDLGARASGLDYEVIGSDVDPDSIRRAGEGRFPAPSLAEVPADLAERFLVAGADAVTVRPDLRARARFVVHDLVGRRMAPPAAVLAQFDLVLCRNVLIYFTPRLQEKAVARLAAVLRPGGLLAVGRSEHLPQAMERVLRPLAGAGRGPVYERIG